MKRLQVFCILALLCCLPVVLGNAQSASTAQISGTVVDPQGAVVPGAQVIATNVATGVPRSVNTTSTGNYVLPNLPPGTYDVKVEAKVGSFCISMSVTLVETSVLVVSISGASAVTSTVWLEPALK